MSRELDLLAREFSKKTVTVIRAEVNLYQSNIQSATCAFLKKVEQGCKKERQPSFILIAIACESIKN